MGLEPGHMGQAQLDPPSVEGWHTGAEWIDTGSLVRRINFVADRVRDLTLPGVRDIVDEVKAARVATPEQLLETCLNLIGPIEVEAETHEELARVAEQAGELRWDTEEEATISEQRGGRHVVRYSGIQGIPVLLAGPIVPAGPAPAMSQGQQEWEHGKSDDQRGKSANQESAGSSLLLQPLRWQSRRAGRTGFTQPVDVAVAPGGATYVLNRSPEFAPSSRVSKVTIGSSWGEEEFILVFGSHGPGDGEFQRTTALALDKNGNVYVADEWHNRISIFDKDGNFLEKWGTSGAGKGELARPWGIKLDRDDNLWVVDSANHRVQAFTKDGKFLDAWGQGGRGRGRISRTLGHLDRQ